ncbi:MAG TPA: hypothetical protein VH933_01095 [Aestuariivirgaceae bacterium]|jgi:hypothetical protein
MSQSGHTKTRGAQTTEAPRLQTVDDRLARIEDLLVRASMRLDNIEHHLSNLLVSSRPR